MFVPFECSVEDIKELKKKVDKLSYTYNNRLNGIKTFAHAPYNKEVASENFYKAILQQCKGTNGVIDGSNLQSLNFPFDNGGYHFFISYSHNDEAEASYLYQWLTSHGLTCFLDSTIWNSADKLLASIDKQYCRRENSSHYDYHKRNFSTSHVHAMLSMAMLEAIDRSECCIFIKSNASIPLADGIKNQTLSPWIYEENLFMNKIQRRVPQRLRSSKRICFSEGGRLIEGNENLRIAYNLQCDFMSITSDDLFSLRIGSALDTLYEKKGVIIRTKI